MNAKILLWLAMPAMLLAPAKAAAAAGAATSVGPDVTGGIPFRMGRANTLAFTVGDGGTGPFKAVLMGEASLPTHAVYRPADLGPFGQDQKLPVVLWANGGCRNSSGEFRNFLSEVASHGFIIVAIGPALSAATMSSEAPVYASQTSDYWVGLDWVVRENQRPGSEYFGKVDTAKVAVMGQSCGGVQALEASLDPRVTTSVIWNSGVVARTGNFTPPQQAAITAAQATFAARTAAVPEARRAVLAASLTFPRSDAAITSALESLAAADQSLALAQAAALEKIQASPNRLTAEQRPLLGGPLNGPAMTRAMLQQLHAPIAYFIGGPGDLAFPLSEADFAEINHVPLLRANLDVGHYPATYRQPNGGAFAQAGVQWLKWQLRGDAAAGEYFTADRAGISADPAWTVEKKNLRPVTGPAR